MDFTHCTNIVQEDVVSSTMRQQQYEASSSRVLPRQMPYRENSLNAAFALQLASLSSSPPGAAMHGSSLSARSSVHDELGRTMFPRSFPSRRKATSQRDLSLAQILDEAINLSNNILVMPRSEQEQRKVKKEANCCVPSEKFPQQ